MFLLELYLYKDYENKETSPIVRQQLKARFYSVPQNGLVAWAIDERGNKVCWLKERIHDIIVSEE